MPTIYIRDVEFAINMVTAAVAISYSCAWLIAIADKIRGIVVRGIGKSLFLMIIYLRVLNLNSWKETYSDRAADMHIMAREITISYIILFALIAHGCGMVFLRMHSSKKGGLEGEV